MKKLILLSVCILMSSFVFANTLSTASSIHLDINSKSKNIGNPLHLSFDLGDVSQLNEKELNNLLNNLQTPTDSEIEHDATSSYQVSISFMVDSVTVKAAGKSSTWKGALDMAKKAVQNEVKAAKELALSINED